MKYLRKNVLSSAVAYALPLIAALLSIPLLVMHLGTDLYGLYTVCLSLLGFMALVDFGMGQAVIRYVADYEAKEQRNQIQPLLGMAYSMYLLIGLLGAGILYMAAPWLAVGLYREDSGQQLLAQSVLQITAIPLLFSYVNQFFLSICKAYHRFDWPALIHNGAHLGGILLAALLVVIGQPLPIVLWGYAFTHALALLAGYRAARVILPKDIRLVPTWQLSMPAGVWGFSAYTFLGNLVGVLTSRGDKVAVGILLGTEAVTYYQIPYTIAQMANGVMHSLTQITLPRFTELLGNKQHSALGLLYRQVLDAGFILSMTIAVLLVTTGEVFLTWWISPEMAEKAYPVLVVMAGYFFLQSNTLVSYWVLQGAGMARLTAGVAVLDATVYAVALYYLSSHYGYIGAAVALFFLLLGTLLQYYWVVERVGCSYQAHLFRLLGFGVITVGASYAMMSAGAWLALPPLAYLAVNVSLIFVLVLGGGGLCWYWCYRSRLATSK